MNGEFVIRWTARMAVACYAARLFCDTGGARKESSLRIARWWWTAGCLWFLIHVAAAFHFQHRWDHATAFAHTARRTAETIGWNSGTGLYVNDAFVCLWLADTIVWWRHLSWPLNRRAYWAVQCVFGFLMIQATAVFGPPFWKPVVIIFVAVLMIQILRSRGRDAGQKPSASFNP